MPNSIKTREDLRGRYVLLRTSLNVPVENDEVRNQFRLMRDLPTINFLRDAGARVILCGHIGSNGEQSLAPVAKVLGQQFPIQFSSEVLGPNTEKARDAMQDGEVLLIENLRKDPREKKNDLDFARELSELAEIYVNDAFPASHREHASIVGVPQFLPSFVGLNFIHEFNELSRMLEPQQPGIFILGGAKFDTKMPLVEKFLDIYEHIFIGGALANDFFKAKGYEIGQSLVSDVDLSNSPLINHPKIIIPTDVVVNGPNGVRVTTPDKVTTEEKIYDVGPESVAMIAPLISEAKTILWNGPFGDYEEGFEEQTITCAKLIAQATGYSVVGGGDTVAAIETLCNQEQYGFLSTAGGAMLTFLELGTLPGIEALYTRK